MTDTTNGSSPATPNLPALPTTPGHLNREHILTLAQRPGGSSWGVDGGGYSVDQFYTASQDRRGQYQTIRVSIQPQYAAQLARIIQQGAVPFYQTQQDVIRDALAHRLEWLANEYLMDPDLAKVVSMQRRLSTLQRHSLEMDAHQQFLAGVQEIVEKARMAEDRETMGEAIQAIRDELPGMKEPWAGKVRGVLEEAEGWMGR